MKRVVPFAVLTLGLAPPAAAQQVSAPLTPTPPAISLGAGLPAALANPANSSGGVPLMAGAAAAGDCLTWSATGIADAGSSCLLAPIGAAVLAGTGAASAASLADRATDFGATFNLKTDFGAKCDGATDDTTAIQAWLDKAASGVTLVAPGGTCAFSQPLTVGAASNFTIRGAGHQATVFKYSGASANATLLTLNAPNAAAVTGITLSDFRLTSTTTMTGGFALQANGLFASVIQNVSIDKPDYLDSGDGNFCGGVWFNGASGVDLINANAYSAQNCGDGVRVNANLGATAELRIVGGNLGSGWANGLHMAGGFGGLRCDETNIAGNGNGVLIDNAGVATANREFGLGSTCAVDSSATNGILVNDTLANGGMLDVAGWVASTAAGPGVRIQKWANGIATLRGNAIYNNCGSGVEVDDASAHVRIGSSETVNANGQQGFGAACAAYQTGHAGYGYGVEATASTTNIWSTASVWGNWASSFNANANSLNWVSTAAGAALWNQFGNAGLVLADGGGASYNSSIYFQDGLNTTKWQLGMGYDSGAPKFTIWDSANSSRWLLSCASGGVCVWGETSASKLTLNGTLSAANGQQPAATGTCAVTGSLGGQMAGSFKASGACSNGAVVLTFSTAQNSGYACDAHDLTTPADLMNETAYTTISVTFSGVMANNDLVVWKCVGF